MNTLGIYVQVPFCQTKCTYCNFHTGVVSAGRYAPYIAAVEREIRALAGSGAEVSTPSNVSWIPERLGTDTVDTIYIGGGTPSLLEPSLPAQLLQSIREDFACDLREVTLEADPETVEPDKAAAWAAAGIDRISFGTQSFVDEELRAAGRMHRRADIYRAVPILREAGIANISFDLIAGLPKQTSASWQQSLTEAVALAPEHVSVYIMEIDEGSRLGLEVLQNGARYSAEDLPSEEFMAEFYETAQGTLKSGGYQQYEISNWARPGRESLHNLKYWRREPYIGFGAGAHSFVGNRRWANVHDAAEYVKRVEAGVSPVESLDTVTPEMALEEEIFLGLRKREGINVRFIEQSYGVILQEKIERLRAAGMVEQDGDRVHLPEAKLSVSNEVIVELLR